jgi:hypothetical protein
MRDLKLGMQQAARKFTTFARIIFDMLEITGKAKYMSLHFIRSTTLRQSQPKLEQATGNFSVKI